MLRLGMFHLSVIRSSRRTGAVRKGMLNRTEPDLEPALVLTEIEIKVLDHLIPDPAADPSPARTLSLYLIKIARLGGYLARAKDPPPGNIVMWRGLSRLNDIALGAALQINNVGN